MTFVPGDLVIIEQGEGILHIKLEGIIDPAPQPSQSTLPSRVLHGPKNKEPVYTIEITRVIEQGTQLTFKPGDIIRAKESNLKPL